MIPLLTIDVGDGSSLVLGVLGDEPEQESNVPRDANLMFQHKQRGGEEALYPVADGRFNLHYPVMVDGRPHVVFYGEVDPCVDGVLMKFSEPDSPPYEEYLAQAHEIMGRRVWMSHPQPFGRKLVVWLGWLHGQPEHIMLPAAGGYAPLP